MFAGRHHLTALALCWLSRPLHTHAADINSACSWQIVHDSVMSENGMLHSLHLLSACCTKCVCALKLCRNLAALFNVVCACRVCLCMQSVFVRAERCAIQAGYHRRLQHSSSSNWPQHTQSAHAIPAQHHTIALMTLLNLQPHLPNLLETDRACIITSPPCVPHITTTTTNEQHI